MVNHYYQFGWSVAVNELVLSGLFFLANVGFLQFSSTVLFHQVCVVSRPTHTR